jgi:hypothetical protein
VATQGTVSTGTAHATTTFLPLQVTPYQVQASLSTDIGAIASVPFSNLSAGCGTATFVPPFTFRPHNDVIVTLQAAQQVRGRFTISYVANQGSGSTTLYAIDVGDDGTVEATNATAMPPMTPVTFRGTLPVRLSNYTGGHILDERLSLAAQASLVVAFVPDSGCTGVQVAPACGALSLVSRPNFTLGSDQVVQNLQTSGNALAALVYGFQPAVTPLPLPPGCVLTNDAAALRLLLPDGSGQATHSIATVPPSLRPCSFYAQAVELDLGAGTLTTSPSLRIDCQ